MVGATPKFLKIKSFPRLSTPLTTSSPAFKSPLRSLTAVPLYHSPPQPSPSPPQPSPSPPPPRPTNGHFNNPQIPPPRTSFLKHIISYSVSYFAAMTKKICQNSGILTAPDVKKLQHGDACCVLIVHSEKVVNHD